MLPAGRRRCRLAASLALEHPVQYIVSAGGRPIGTTDLGFVALGSRIRSGWFFPNADGERLMPIVAGPFPATLEFLRNRRAGDEPRDEPSRERDEQLCREAMEACRQAAMVPLSLHHADGTPVPTEDVGIRDTERLLALAREDLARSGLDEPWSPDEPDADPELEVLLAELEGEDAEPFDGDGEMELFRLSGDGAAFERLEWEPEPDPEFPRYQVQVFLARGVSLPDDRERRFVDFELE